MSRNSSKNEVSIDRPTKAQPQGEGEPVEITNLTASQASSANSTRNLRMRHVMDVIQTVRKKGVRKIAEEAIQKAMK